MNKSTEKIVKFLIDRERSKEDSSDYSSLIPPTNLGFDSRYKLKIYKDIDEKYFQNKVQDYLTVISDIYNLDSNDLQTLLIEKRELLAIRVYDEETADGEINLSKFDYMIQKISDILLKTADFVLEGKVQCDNPTGNPRANSFLNACKFLQTKKGSFISRISLPSEEMISPANLLNDGVQAKEINKKFFGMMEFVNSSFFASNEIEINDVFIQKNKQNINTDILKDINSLYKNCIKNVEFKYTNSADYELKSSKPQKINGDRLEKFYGFINKIEKEIVKNSLDSLCYVNGVYDRYLEGGKKHCVTVISDQFGSKIEIHIDDVSEKILSLAIDAYKQGSRIMVVGEVDELKSYLKVTKLVNFESVS